MRRVSLSFAFLAASAFTLLLVACGGSSDEALPEGEFTATGSVQAVPLSLSRRGTHLLIVDGAERFYLESSQSDLSDVEGSQVVVTGFLEKNTDPSSLPVLRITQMRTVGAAVQEWRLGDTGVRLQGPADWNMHTFEDGWRFTQSGSSLLLFSVLQLEDQADLPDGDVEFLGPYRAIVGATDTGERTYTLRVGTTSLRILTPLSVSDPLGPTLARVLQSIASTSEARSSTAAISSQPSSSAGAPCGGPAGILCPQGQYCEITDSASGIGRCKSLRAR